MKTNKSIFAAAVDAWPEDEAALTADSYNGRKDNEWTASELAEGLARDVAHMHKVFGFESDAAELIHRYDSALAAAIARANA